MNTRGNRLREEREKVGMSRDSLAELGGVRRNAQGAYERDERDPDAEYLARVATAGIDVAYVITGQRAVPAEASLTAEEAALVENYRRAGDQGRAAADVVLSALAALQSQR